ncbi:MAG: hypothetical protein JXQ69_03000 [Paludibacteraceae bacterium]|nr:hypothetical protein [Paludibacteraceae bacterium]MBN2787271.1 hypothetical protein [Paludibacteraceae bacterium]
MIKQLFILSIGLLGCFVTSFSRNNNLQDTLFITDTLVVYDTLTIPKRTAVEKINDKKKSDFQFFKEIAIITSDYENIGVLSTINYKSYFLTLTVGTNFNLAQPLIGGIGFGSNIKLFSQFSLFPEITSMWYFPFGRDYPPQNNNHLKLGFVYSINKSFSINIAPSIYCGWRNNVAGNKEYNEIIHIISPIKPFYAEETSYNSTFDIGIGCSLQIIYKFGKPN